MRFLSSLVIAVGLSTTLAPIQAFANEIGVVASISPTLRGTPPGAADRILNQGERVVQDELIQSSDRGRAQLLFLDETTLTIAPSSRVVLDEFVYDPGSSTGALGLQLSRGALRLIGGQAMRGGDAVVRTPTATIGIRGSSAIVIYDGKSTTAIFLMGDQMCLTQNGTRTCTNRSGGVLTEDGYLGRAAPNYLARVLARLDGPPPATLLRRGTAPTDRIRPGDPLRSTSGEIADIDALDDRITTDTGFGTFGEQMMKPHEPDGGGYEGGGEITTILEQGR